MWLVFETTATSNLNFNYNRMAGRQGNTNVLCNVLDKQDTKRAFKIKLATKIYRRTDFLACTSAPVKLGSVKS